MSTRSFSLPCGMAPLSAIAADSARILEPDYRRMSISRGRGACGEWHKLSMSGPWPATCGTKRPSVQS